MLAPNGAYASTGTVSNLSVSPSRQGLAVNYFYPSAQAFTTGGNSGGYTLQQVKLRLQDEGNNIGHPQVALYSSSNSAPGTSLAILANPSQSLSSSSPANYVYTCNTGCELDANTQYFIVATPPQVPGTRGTYWWQSPSGSETNTPTNAGWSIADDAKYRNNQGGSWLDEGAVKLMEVSYALPTLTAGRIGATRARLTIGNYSSAWYYKYTTPAGGLCSSEAVSAGNASVDVKGLTRSTAYTFKAYSDSSCNTEIATADNFTTLAQELLTHDITKTSVSLQLYPHDGEKDWSYRISSRGTSDGGCNGVPRGSGSTYTSLSAGTDYTAEAFRGLACNASKQVATVDFTTLSDDAGPLPVLSVSSVTNNGATLSLANHTGDWWYQGYAGGAAFGSCTKVDTGTRTATLSGLEANTSYAYKAFSDSDCDNPSQLQEWSSYVMFITTGPVTVTISNKTATSFRVTLNNFSGRSWALRVWRQAGDGTFPGTACQRFVNGETSADVTGLESGKEYTVSVYKGAHCNKPFNEINTSVTTTSLTADANATSATLTLNHHDGDWWHQEVVGGGVGTAGAASVAGATNTSSGAVCTPVGNGSTATLSNLTAGTNYTYGAYGAATCSESDELATATFTTQFDTAPDPVAAVTVAHQGSSLAVSWDAPARATHYHVTYTDNNGTSWQLAALEHTDTSLTINGVDSSKTYLVGVRAKNAAGSSGWTNSAAATFTVPDPVASVTAVHKGSSLDVSWPAAARATHYHVTYTGDNGTSWQLAALEHAGTSLTINGCGQHQDLLGGGACKECRRQQWLDQLCRRHVHGAGPGGIGDGSS